MERFIRSSGASEAYEHWNYLQTLVKKATQALADWAHSTASIFSQIGKFQWEVAVARIGQLASEMRLSTGGQSIGGSNGNADELTNWDGTKKRGLGI